MHATVRQYNHAADYERVSQFLVRTHRITGDHINWLQPRWEYMHYHSLIRNVDLNAIGIWEARGEVVGVVHPEHAMGTAYVEIDPRYDHLKAAMLRYAEQHLSTLSDGVRRVRVYINEQDNHFQELALERGYARGGGYEPMSRFAIPDLFPAISLPEGFRLKSLAEDNDLQKVDQVLWRGFDHGDEPPEGEIEDRAFMQSAPNYRKDLNLVVEAPNGHFVSYCGMWYEPVHAIAYVEPVATDPDYRRMGLGRAVVLEGIRRCGALGATAAYVGSAMPFYLALGFRQIYNRSAWQREWNE
jgi:predicted N-acetyltransferase YhbS